MRLNLVAFVMMIIAIAIGKLVGAMILDAIGGSIPVGGILGAVIVGFVCYLVYALATKSKIKLVAGLVFAVFVYIADILASYVADALALGSADIMLFVVTGGIMAVLWSWIGAKIAGSPSSMATTSRRRRRR